MKRKQRILLPRRRFGYVILIIIKFGHLLLGISLRIVNALRNYIKQLVNKTQLRLVFSTHFSVFGYLMKHSPCVWYTTSQAWFPYGCICRVCRTKKYNDMETRLHAHLLIINEVISWWRESISSHAWIQILNENPYPNHKWSGIAFLFNNYIHACHKRKWKTLHIQ